MVLKLSVVIFDACILYPFHLRNIVVQIAGDRLVDARWTDEIHDEWIRNLVADVPGIPIERLKITRKLMNHALPDATVTGYRTGQEGKAFPCVRASVSSDPFCGDTPQRPGRKSRGWMRSSIRISVTRFRVRVRPGRP